LSKASLVSSSGDGRKLVLEKDDFDSAMRGILASGKGSSEMSVDTQRVLSDILAYIFNSFDRSNSGKPNALEIACGFTVLCNGKKSDKLEHAFEVLDKNRVGKLPRSEMQNYLRSFLTVLLCVTCSNYLQRDVDEDKMVFMDGSPCEMDPSTVSKAAEVGSEWAASQAFKGCFSGRAEEDMLNFDDFADWYTRKGYSCIPWLELLDLRKWVITT